MKKRLFGTDGIRGLVGQYPLTEEVVLRLGMAIGKSVASARVKGINKVIIGKDTRSSCQMLQETLVPGILSKGIEVIDIGVVPTPAVAFLTKRLHAGMGIMISASHNQVEDNGIKLFSEDGYKMSNDAENQIEEFVYQGLNDRCDSKFPTDRLKGYAEVISPGENLRQMYISNVLESMEKRLDLKGMKVIIDCANGSISGIVSSVFGKLGLEVIMVNNKPDGSNINLNCGSSVPSVVRDEVLRHKADMGISFDGDGDRVVMVDGSGKVLDGDHLMAIIGIDLINRKKLVQNTVVATVMSNMGLDEAFENVHGKVIRSEVGDKHVVKKIIDNGLILGGEPSGHIIFMEYNTTSDALLTSLKLLETIERSGRTLKELSMCIEKNPQVIINVPVRGDKPIRDFPEISKAIEKSRDKLGRVSNIVIRYSGTEPLVRIMVEGKERRDVEKEAVKLANVVMEALA